MAIKPNKKGVVKGTKKNDKIVWKDAAAWRKSLTVNAMAGNDLINFKKSKYKNKLNGDDGNDTIYGGTKNDTITGGNGNDKLYGYNGNDVIYGNSGNNILDGGAGKDTLYAGTGSDNLYGGKGNDVMQSGTGGATTFRFTKGDGTDTIKKSKASDIIQIDSVVGVGVAKNSAGKLEITYGSDKIIVDNYNFNGSSNIDTIKVKNSKGGYDTISIYEKLNGGGGNYTYYSTEENEYYTPTWNPSWQHGAKLTTGNHTFVYDYKNTHGQNYFGCDIIMSPNTKNTTLASKYTDTIRFVDSAIETGSFDIFLRGEEMMLHNWNDEGYATYIYYTDIVPNKPNLVIQDKYRSYNVKAYVGSATVDNSKLAGNTITLLDTDEKSKILSMCATGAGICSSVIANDRYNYTGSRNVNLTYTYNGGHDLVETGNNDYTDEIYNINSLSKDTFLRITEDGGNDIVRFANNSTDDIRLVFDVYQNGNTSVNTREKQRIFFAYKDSVTLDKIIASHAYYEAPVNINDAAKGSIFMVDLSDYEKNQRGIEIIVVNGQSINTEAWYDAVMTRAGQWLRKQTVNYGGMSYALTDDNHPLTEEQKNEVLKCYTDVKYSDIKEGNITSGAAVNLSGYKFNRYTLSGSYNGAAITSGNTLLNGYNDTLIIKDGSFAKGTLTAYTKKTATNDDNKLYLNANGKEISYTGATTSFLSGNASELVLIDQDNRKISVQSHNKDNAYTYYSFENNQSNMLFINADEISKTNPHNTSGSAQDSVHVSTGSRNSYNYIQTMGGIKLSYSDNGNLERCRDVVVTSYATDDIYNVSINNGGLNTQIEEHGGNDILRISIGSDAYDWDNLGIICNVTATLQNDNWVYTADRNHTVYLDKKYVTEQTLKAATSADLIETTGVNVLDKSSSGGIDIIRNEYYKQANLDAWFNQIKETVGMWVAGSKYNSVAEAVNDYYSSGADISGLINAFNSVDGRQFVNNN